MPKFLLWNTPRHLLLYFVLDLNHWFSKNSFACETQNFEMKCQSISGRTDLPEIPFTNHTHTHTHRRNKEDT